MRPAGPGGHDGPLAGKPSRKTNPGAQHKLATFSSGSLRIDRRGGQTEVDYEVRSPALFLTFLAPLLFLALGQAIVGIGMLNEAMSAEQSDGKDDEEEEPGDLHWVDEMLGAPAPEKPDRDDNEKDEDHSPTKSFGLAAIFALIYLVGRFLEPRLLRSSLRKALSGDEKVTDGEFGVSIEQTDRSRQ
ncbi:hypothetical protein WAB17_13700 [Parerythrobacter aurantius]|uniref:hypothetical protein n=1 Tax=Parerythrobacter aurantius TaxID=3127706 RepID=UPI00324B6760